nr:hypothetical protein [Amycolatopsis sp. YIM 10]
MKDWVNLDLVTDPARIVTEHKVTDQALAGCVGGEIPADEIRCRGRGLVRQWRRRRVSPAIARSRMIRSTSLWLTTAPRRRSSAVTRGLP